MARAATLIVIAVTSLCLIGQIDSARILGFFPAPSKSHLIIHTAIADALSQAGHNVTVISAFPNINKKAKYNFVELDVGGFDPAFMQEMLDKPLPIYRRFGTMMDMVLRHANETMASEKMQRFLKENGEGTFDLLIIGYFMNDFHYGLAGHFKCPLAISFMIQPVFSINSILGNPHELSYVPTIFSGLKQPMQFCDRVKNFFASMFEQFVMEPLMRYRMQKYYDLYFPSDRYPSFDAIRQNVSMVLTNHHFSQGPIRPNVPALIEIGGIQIKEKSDPLPTDIAQVLDTSQNGVIYFSFGSNVQGNQLSKEKAQMMFNVLSELPYTVLWKWGDSDFPGTAKNIVFKSWLPQDDILAHRNVKLFITHGGQGSVVESQYHGVPMVGIPLFGDQPANMASVEGLGFGLKLDFWALEEDSFRKALLEVLENPKYAHAVKSFSKLYRDRPMTPRQTVVFWLEYVLRHKGAPHLQSPAVFLNRWQLMSLDVIGFVLVVLTVFVFALVWTCKLLCCRGRKSSKKTDAKQLKAKKSK